MLKYKVKEIKDGYGHKNLEEQVNEFLEEKKATKGENFNLIDIKYHTQVIALKHVTHNGKLRSTVRDASALIIYEESK